MSTTAAAPAASLLKESATTIFAVFCLFSWILCCPFLCRIAKKWSMRVLYLTLLFMSTLWTMLTFLMCGRPISLPTIDMSTWWSACPNTTERIQKYAARIWTSCESFTNALWLRTLPISSVQNHTATYTERKKSRYKFTFHF